MRISIGLLGVMTFRGALGAMFATVALSLLLDGGVDVDIGERRSGRKYC